MVQFKEAWGKERLSRGFIVSLILILAAAGACRLIFWDDWRPVKRNPIWKGSEEEAGYYAAYCLNKRCRLYRPTRSGTYDEAGKAWEFKGTCDHGGDATYTCRVYFGADCEYHLESLWFGWPKN